MRRHSSGASRQQRYVWEDRFLALAEQRFALQYIAYGRFDDARDAYDEGRNASDNNTLYLLTWLVF